MKNWMEKAASPSTTHSMESCGDLQCVGTLEIVRPKPVGFLCGSIPVPTDNSFHSFNSSALLPSTQTVSAPRYRMLPTETDLNALPVVSNLPDKVLPIVAAQSKPAGELAWETDAVSSNLRRRCEALAVTGLVEYGDEIDVIAPADIVKQIFKMPYSKARLSIAVRRIGQTLVLNTGPDPEEGEKLVRRHNNQPKCADQTLFLNFAMHSVRMEACDCPPTHHASSEGQSNSSFLPGATMSPFVGNSDEVTSDGAFSQSSDYSQLKQDEIFWKKKKNRNKGHHSIKKASHVGEKPRCSMQESEKHKRVSNDGFLRVLFWQFHNFRMLLGSDLLLFSNDKYVSVSLHLLDVKRQVTPLNWLEAWLDNVMASVPELAICYHQDGVVQGYELLKTDDIFLLKGISEDGTPAFHPYVVQQNGLSVLRFLQENCKQDPGAYWLYKSAGDDVIQLFDLSVIPKTHDSNECEDSSITQPSLRHGARSDSFFSLGTLLYRIAHKLSLSMAPNNREKCASFFRKCLEFLDEPDHLVVRAFAHEQFARLLLNHDQELELTSDSLPLECEAMVSVDSLEHFSSSEANFGENMSLSVAEDHLSGDGRRFYDVPFEPSVGMTLEVNVSSTRNSTSDDEAIKQTGNMQNSNEPLAVCKISSMPTQMVQSVSDPIFSKLAAVHHVSQAIKSLRWMRQLQTSEELVDHDGSLDIPPSNLNFSVCACGDADCIQVCDIKEWLPTSKIDHRLWKLVLLLGESYLALAQAYMEDKQLHQVLKVVEVACSVYGSMPQYFEDARYISSIVKHKFSREYTERNEMKKSYTTDSKDVKSSSEDDIPSFECFSSTFLFWARAWTLVGDVHIEFHFIKGKELTLQTEGKYSPRDLKMSFEVLKEVQRLKKKLGQYNRNCSSCSLANCSCQSDRASSGNSASCSSGDSVPYSRKHVKRYSSKFTSYSSLGDSDDSQSHPKLDNRNISETDSLQFGINCDNHLNSRVNRDNGTGCSVTTASYTEPVVSLNNSDTGSTTSCVVETASKEGPTSKKGGIFKYLREPVLGDAEDNLSAALTCYEKARKALHGLPTASLELQSVIKKVGWVCNEMGRNRLERKELNKAQHAFAQAISAFREVSDHTNIILIYCNLGHGRRALAEEMVSKIDNLKLHPIFHDAYNQAVESAKIEYSEALKYYGAAKSELNNVVQKVDGVPNGFKNEVYTQFAHTFLRLGMLLATEDLTADVYEKEAMGDNSLVDVSTTDKKTRKELRKYEISANDAIREALSVYESLGDLRKQEAAYAYYQLACHQRDCCLKFLELDCKKSSLPKSESSIVPRVKQYAYLAERNWQKALEFYGPETHPRMYLTIVMERSALPLSLSSALHSNPMLESALFRMLGARHMPKTILASFETEYPEVCARFWGQLQMLLKKLLAQTLNVNTNKSVANSQQTTGSNKCRDAGKLRDLYKMSLKSKNLSQLHDMHVLWTSSEIGHSLP
ncbi:hypothetical protein K2173_015306 [Erythroxylum novogranatense]|uniref:EDRF1 N-terminal domain-containing protein n=1 Tax=Erythroxylum novogranatense TaxID=1862640 RepID=A0AAV8T2N4_9ROSI|nr:hypothetical protein K2173_015306 [Erythroxylum novogranatense]